MCRAVQLYKKVFGKLKLVQSTVGDCTSFANHRLSVVDRKSGLRFLVDTGANISVLPATKRLFGDSASISDYKLYAANGSEIKTFGVKTLVLNFSLRRPFTWAFVLTDVRQPINGADFLSHTSWL